MDKKQYCKNCKWIKRFKATDNQWMDVCTSQEPDEEDVGLYRVYVVNQSDFDANLCLDYQEEN